MADITWFEVEKTAPELGSGRISVLAQDYIIGVVNQLLAPPAWKDDRILRIARIFYAAHMGTLERRKGIPGPSASKSMGGMSESFGAGPLSTSFLATTSWGQLYLTIAKTRAFRAGFTTGMVRNPLGGGWNGGGVL